MKADKDTAPAQRESIGLYVHIPFCRRKCKYCAFYSVPVEKRDTGALVDCLLDELDRYDKTPVRTVYIGGGTPTCLPEGDLIRLVKDLRGRFKKTEEFTVEASPAHLDPKRLEKLRKLGVDRLSIGAQSFHQKVLDTLGRNHKVKDIENAVAAAKEAGFANISLDLIFAIPGQTPESWSESLRRAIELETAHVSAYALSWEPLSPLTLARDRGELTPVDQETDRMMYECAIDTLADAGYHHYEISNFAVPGYECRHNLAYWANDPYIGIGPAAHSFYDGRRYENIADIDRYMESIPSGESPAGEVHEPTPLEFACETAVLNLRRRAGIDLTEYYEKTGFNLMQLFNMSIGKFQSQHLLAAEPGRIFLTRKALPIADTVLQDFASL